jgi:hypothetical protein
MKTGTARVTGLLLPERAASLRTRSAWATPETLNEALGDRPELIVLDLRGWGADGGMRAAELLNKTPAALAGFAGSIVLLGRGEETRRAVPPGTPLVTLPRKAAPAPSSTLPSRSPSPFPSMPPSSPAPSSSPSPSPPLPSPENLPQSSDSRSEYHDFVANFGAAEQQARAKQQAEAEQHHAAEQQAAAAQQARAEQQATAAQQATAEPQNRRDA